MESRSVNTLSGLKPGSTARMRWNERASRPEPTSNTSASATCDDDERVANALSLAAARRSPCSVAKHWRELGLAGADERDRAEEESCDDGDGGRDT